jgi:hypothetical protein
MEERTLGGSPSGLLTASTASDGASKNALGEPSSITFKGEALFYYGEIAPCPATTVRGLLPNVSALATI